MDPLGNKMASSVNNTFNNAPDFNTPTPSRAYIQIITAMKIVAAASILACMIGYKVATYATAVLHDRAVGFTRRLLNLPSPNYDIAAIVQKIDKIHKSADPEIKAIVQEIQFEDSPFAYIASYAFLEHVYNEKLTVLSEEQATALSRKIIIKIHPDKNPSANTTPLFQLYRQATSHVANNTRPLGNEIIQIFYSSALRQVLKNSFD